VQICSTSRGVEMARIPVVQDGSELDEMSYIGE
jgi:hypothetical protein